MNLRTAKRLERNSAKVRFLLSLRKLLPVVPAERLLEWEKSPIAMKAVLGAFARKPPTR